jgi:hypothetical protein
MNVYSMLGQGNFLMANKHIARKTSLNSAVLLADLISKRQYFIINNDISTKDWFFNTIENIELDTTLTKHQQSKCLKELKEAGFLNYNNKTVGNKKQFMIYDHNIISFLGDAQNNTNIQKLKKRKLEVKKAETRNQKSGSSYNNSKEQEEKNKNKLTSNTEENFSFFSLPIAMAIVQNGGVVNKSQIDDDTYTALYNLFGCDEGGNIKALRE